MRGALLCHGLVASALLACGPAGSAIDGGSDVAAMAPVSSFSGTVGDVDLSTITEGFAVRRAPSTRLNPHREEMLDVYLGPPRAITSFCPDIGTSATQPTLRVELYGYASMPARFAVCNEFSCTAPYARIWLQEAISGRRHLATTGAVNVTAAGSTLSATLEGTLDGATGPVSGTLETIIACTDARAR